MEILTCEQGSNEWFAARIGSIGGSSIQSVMAKGQGKSRRSLMYRLVGEILSGKKYEGYSNADMERGVKQESDARNMYETYTGVEVQQVGLFKETKHTHYSPDGCVGQNGLIEIKSVIPSVHVETILADNVPAAYRKQPQWGCFICQRDWCDFVSYSPLVSCQPIFIKRVERDEKLIREMDEESYKFILEMEAIVRKIKEG